MGRYLEFTLLLLSSAALAGGGPGCVADPAAEAGDAGTGGFAPCQDLSADSDKDGISDGTEGCLEARDSDGDRKPDYLDEDSDNDGLTDSAEDRNGDGLLGCCLETCHKPGSAAQKECILTTDGCGSGQMCTAGKCRPAVSFSCSEGETDPSKKDTFGDGRSDAARGTLVCSEPAGTNAPGLKVLKTEASTGGDWLVALEPHARYREYTISGAGASEAAAAFDHPGWMEEVAGFVVSQKSTKAIQYELTGLLAALESRLPGQVAVRSSGTQGKSHDRFDNIERTVLDLSLGMPATASTARDMLVAALLGRAASELGNPPPAFGSFHNKLVVSFSTVKRFGFAKDATGALVSDAKGYPTDSGDKSQWRLLVMGAVAVAAGHADPTMRTGIVVDDLAWGTALARSSAKMKNECDVYVMPGLTAADIIWVVDSSAVFQQRRGQDLLANAMGFFARALASGLDFRMGVTGMCDPAGPNKALVGQLCSDPVTGGGIDRFLLPSEQATFEGCVRNVARACSGQSASYGLVNAKAAITGHLPREDSSLSRIRPWASLVVIAATDRVPGSLAGIIGARSSRTCTLDGATAAKLDTALAPYLELMTGAKDPEARAAFSVIGGRCQSTCGAQVAHGYSKLVQFSGGVWADVCEKNIGSTLQSIIDGIGGCSCPCMLDKMPIGASLTVSFDGMPLPRSRRAGFDFRPSSRSLVFINIPWVKGVKGTNVVIGYRYWDSSGS